MSERLRADYPQKSDVLRILQRLETKSLNSGGLGWPTIGKWKVAVQDELGADAPNMASGRGLLRQLEEDGFIRFLDEDVEFNKPGRSVRTTGKARKEYPITLAEIAELAERSVDPNAGKGEQAGRPRRTESEKREAQLEVLTTTQWNQIRAAFNVITAAKFGEKGPGAWKRISEPSYFEWDDEELRWGLRDLMERSLDDHTRGRKKISKTSRYRHLGSIDLALDLAATHGLTRKASCQPVLELPSSKSWMAFAERVAALLADRRTQKRSAALRAFFKSVLPYVSDHPDPAKKVREHSDEIVGDLELRAKKLSPSPAAHLRAMIKEGLRDGVFTKGKASEYRDWGIGKARIISGSEALELGSLQKDHKDWDARLPYRAQLAPETRWFDATDPLNLGAVLDHFTGPVIALKNLGLPPRGKQVSYPPARKVSSKANRQKWSSADTVKGHVENLTAFYNVVCDSLQDGPPPERFVDLFTLNNILLLEDPECGYEVSGRMSIAMTIGLIASPCLEGIARGEGKDELAERLKLVCSAAYGEGYPSENGVMQASVYKALKDMQVEVKPEDKERAMARAVEQAWVSAFVDAKVKVPTYSDRKDRYAYDAMMLTIKAAERHLLRKIGADTWDEAIDADLSHLLRRDYHAIQGLALWYEQIVLPLRSKTLRQVELDHREGFDDESASYDVPGDIVKTGRGVLADGVASPVWRFYKERVREHLLAGEESSRIWVADFNNGQTKPGQDITKAVLNSRLRTVVEIGCDELGVDASTIKPEARTHAPRYACATYEVRVNENYDNAYKLLGHADDTMVRKVYAVPDNRASAIRRPVTGSDVDQADVDIDAILAIPGAEAELRARLGVDGP